MEFAHSAGKPGASNRNLNRSLLNKTTVEISNPRGPRMSSMTLPTGVRYKQGMIPTENLKF